MVVELTAESPEAGVELEETLVVDEELTANDVVGPVVEVANRLFPPACVVVVVPSVAMVVVVVSPVSFVVGAVVVVVEFDGLAGTVGTEPGRSGVGVIEVVVVVVVGLGRGKPGKSMSTVVVVVVVEETVAWVTTGSSRGRVVVTRAALVVGASLSSVSSGSSVVVVVLFAGARVGGVNTAGVLRWGGAVVVVEVVEEVVVVDGVGAVVAVDEATVPGEIVVLVGVVVVKAEVETVGASVEGTTDRPGLGVKVVVVVVVVVVVATVRGGAVSVTVEAPPPKTPPAPEPSLMPRALVITEPSGRMMMSPSDPPGLIQMRCSSTVTSIGPVPGIAMVWMTAPKELSTIIWRVRSLRRYTRPFNTIGAAVNELGSFRSMRWGWASPLTSRTMPAALESTGTRSPVTDCSGTLMAPSLGVSDLATMTPLRTRVIRPGSTISVSLLFVTTRAFAALLVTVTREVSFEAPLSFELTETNSPAVVST